MSEDKKISREDNMSMTVKIGERVYRMQDAEVDEFINNIRLGQIKPGFSILAIGAKN